MVCMTFLTTVTLVPRSTIVSAIQPPTLAEMAMVIQGSTEKKPELLRSRPSTCSSERAQRAGQACGSALSRITGETGQRCSGD